MSSKGNSSLTDLSQSLLGRFTPSPGSSHNSTNSSPTAHLTDKKKKDRFKDKEDGPKREPSKRERFKRLFSRKSDGGASLNATMSAEDVTHREGMFASNSSVESLQARDVDLRSRGSIDSLKSLKSTDIPKPKLLARDERIPLHVAKSRDNLRHSRSNSGLGFHPVRNLADLDSEDEPTEMSSEIRSPKRNGKDASLIPIPVSRVGPPSGLSSILSAATSASTTPTKRESPTPPASVSTSASTLSSPETPTSQPRSPSPPASTQLPRQVLRSPTNKSKAMKYGNLMKDANATIRPRIKTRKPSAALAERRVGTDETGNGFVVRPRSNSLPTLVGLGFVSDDESLKEKNATRSASGLAQRKGKEKAMDEDRRSPEVKKTAKLIEVKVLEKPVRQPQNSEQEEKVEQKPVEGQKQETPVESRKLDTPVFTPHEPEEEFQSPKELGQSPKVMHQPEPIQLPNDISLPMSPLTPSPALQDFPTLNRKTSLVKSEIDKWEKMRQEKSLGEKRKSFESTVSNASSGWTTDEDQSDIPQKKVGAVNVAPGIVAIGGTTEQLIKAQQEKMDTQQENMDKVAKEVQMVVDEAEAENKKVNGAALHFAPSMEGEASEIIAPATLEAAQPPKSQMSSPKATSRQVEVESLEKYLEKVEVGTFQDYLSPRLVPLPFEVEKDDELLETKEEGGDEDLDESSVFEAKKVAGSILLDSPTTSSLYEQPAENVLPSELPVEVLEEEETEEDEPDEQESEEEERDSDPESELETPESERSAEKRSIKEPDQETKHQVDLCSSATQTELLSPPPTPPPPAIQTRLQTTPALAFVPTPQIGPKPTPLPTVQIARPPIQGTRMEMPVLAGPSQHQYQGRLAQLPPNLPISAGTSLSPELRNELLEWLNVNFDRIDQERKAQRRRQLSVPKRRVVSGSGVPATIESESEEDDMSEYAFSTPDAAISPPSVAETNATQIRHRPRAPSVRSNHTITSVNPRGINANNNTTTQTVIMQTHYVTAYVPTQSKPGRSYYWVWVVVLSAVFLGFLLRYYYQRQKEHLYECGFPEEYVTICLPQSLVEDKCLSFFWPRRC